MKKTMSTWERIEELSNIDEEASNSKEASFEDITIIQNTVRNRVLLEIALLILKLKGEKE